MKYFLTLCTLTVSLAASYVEPGHHKALFTRSLEAKTNAISKKRNGYPITALSTTGGKEFHEIRRRKAQKRSLALSTLQKLDQRSLQGRTARQQSQDHKASTLKASASRILDDESFRLMPRGGVQKSSSSPSLSSTSLSRSPPGTPPKAASGRPPRSPSSISLGRPPRSPSSSLLGHPPKSSPKSPPASPPTSPPTSPPASPPTSPPASPPRHPPRPNVPDPRGFGSPFPSPKTSPVKPEPKVAFSGSSEPHQGLAAGLQKALGDLQGSPAQTLTGSGKPIGTTGTRIRESKDNRVGVSGSGAPIGVTGGLQPSGRPIGTTPSLATRRQMGRPAIGVTDGGHSGGSWVRSIHPPITLGQPSGRPIGNMPTQVRRDTSSSNLIERSTVMVSSPVTSSKLSARRLDAFSNVSPQASRTRSEPGHQRDLQAIRGGGVKQPSFGGPSGKPLPNAKHVSHPSQGGPSRAIESDSPLKELSWGGPTGAFAPKDVRPRIQIGGPTRSKAESKPDIERKPSETASSVGSSSWSPWGGTYTPLAPGQRQQLTRPKSTETISSPNNSNDQQVNKPDGRQDPIGTKSRRP